MMRELADNILDIAQNAVAAKATLLEIALALSTAQDRITLQFCDNGCGISKQDMPYLFSGTKPGKADSDRSLGIGLSVCRTIIKAHGGRVFAGNRPEGGACFMFMLPLTEVEYE